jgi:hypothetical protein
LCYVAASKGAEIDVIKGQNSNQAFKHYSSQPDAEVFANVFRAYTNGEGMRANMLLAVCQAGE